MNVIIALKEEENGFQKFDDIVEEYELNKFSNIIMFVKEEHYTWVDPGTIAICYKSFIYKDTVDGKLKNISFIDNQGGDTVMNYIGASENNVFFTMEV